MVYVPLVAATLRRVARARSDLLIENLALRQQLAMYERQPEIRNAERAFWSFLVGRWHGWRDAASSSGRRRCALAPRSVAELLGLEESSRSTKTASNPR